MTEQPALRAVIVPVTPFVQNCSVVWCVATRRAAIIDPGGDTDHIIAAVRGEDLTVERILITHGHLDHAGAAADLARELAVPIEGPQRADAFWIERIEQEGARFGLAHCRSFVPDRWLEDGDRVSVGEQTLEVIHCPGHTPGHVVYFHAGERVAFVGDVLFQGSVGRTDFPQGDMATLIHSITAKLWPLGDDVVFVPGHGPTSTFGDERRHNPFVGDRALEE